ncbi:hypothetical protein CTEN210_06191 [Chaetoceros tenuissimus]|uniref:Uncharacterized protein n=1 Tax=Chaetoceros tenuissimus TaxID=426638 RepID=A0AAD3H463_9STRA|nr:hypothetical protein CTEN210_06191 [Chaetoceros tenuissimus]
MSVSLSDLIYGSQSESRKEPTFSSPPILRKRRRSPRLSAVNENEAIDRFYETGENTASETPEKRIKYDFETNIEDREFFGTSRRKSVVPSSAQRLRTKVRKEWDPVSKAFIVINDETEEETRIRLEKKKEKLRITNRRYKSRRLNFLKAVDVGGAFEYSTKKEAIEEARKNRSKHELEIDESSSSSDDDDDENVYTSSQQLSQTQSQLDSMMTKAENQEKTPNIVYHDPSENPVHPNHYMWLGHVAPKWNEVKYNYKDILGKLKPKNPQGKQLTQDAKALYILADAIGKGGNSTRKGDIKRNMGTMERYFNNLGTTELIDKQCAKDTLLSVFEKNKEEKMTCPELEISAGLVSSRRKGYLKQRGANSAALTNYDIEETKKAQSTVARFLLGYAHILDNVSTEIMGEIANIIENLDPTYSATNAILSQSQALADNFTTWHELKPCMDKLLEKEYISFEDYESIRQELLSSTSEFFTDPMQTNGEFLNSKKFAQRRKLIISFVMEQRTKFIKDMGDDIPDVPTKLNTSEFYESKGQTLELRQIAKNASDQKYSHVTFNACTSTTSIQLMICIFLSALTNQTQKEIRSNDKIVAIKKELENYLLDAMNDVYFRSSRFTPLKKVLNGTLAFATLMHQSYTVSLGHGALIKKMKEEDGYFSDEDDDSTSSNASKEMSDMIDFQELARTLASNGKAKVRDNKLQIFHRIHLTTGISIIAQCFSSAVAEILSRPTFSGRFSHDTPFDLLRLALVAADKKGEIRRRGEDVEYGSKAIFEDDLIRELEHAAEVFHEITLTAPNNLDAYAWCTASRVALVIISSGIEISKGANIAGPPQYHLEDFDEQRCRHDEYSTIRASAVKSIKALIRLEKKANFSKGGRYYFYMKSLLEWKQATGLLVMRPKVNTRNLSLLREQHALYTVLWAMEDSTETSLNEVFILGQMQRLSSNDAMTILSRIIEKNPNNPTAWLVLGSSIASMEKKRSQQLRKKSYWWGADLDHWKFSMFACSTMNGDRGINCKDLELTRDELVACKDDLDTFVKERCDWTDLKHDVKLTKSTKWLWPKTPCEEDEEDHNIEVDFHIDDELPKSIEPEDNDHDLIVKILSNEGDSTIVAAKALCAHHLFGNCEYVIEAVTFLIRKIIAKQGYIDRNDNNEQENSRLLKWLIASDIDVIHIINEFICKNEKKNEASKVAEPFFQFQTL